MVSYASMYTRNKKNQNEDGTTIGLYGKGNEIIS
jgi:hypothetical protein